MKTKLVKVVQFELVSFFDQSQKPEPRQVVIIYALGSDGVVREFSGSEWRAFPIYDSVTID
jgi:hypothetical protein